MSASVAPLISGQLATRRVMTAKLTIAGATTIVVILAAVGAWVYLGDQRSLGELRQAKAALSSHFAQSRGALREAQEQLHAARDQLAAARSETVEAQTASKSLAERLTRSEKRSQEAEASADDLRRANLSVTGQLLEAQKNSQETGARNAAQTQRITRALARAQLIDESWQFSFAAASGRDVNQQAFAWIRKISALNDPTADKYLDAIVKDPKDGASTAKLVAYLTGSVVDALR